MSGSLILRGMAPYLLWTAVGLSLFVLLRGHNEPGGGFIGGLIGSLGFIFYALAMGPNAARAKLHLAPLSVGGIGLALAAGAGLPALLAMDEPFLTQQWIEGTPIGTTIMFDLGVYLVVLGFALGFVLPFVEDRE
jgi:multicomponent Na+:H+ antiporter subunit B